MYHYWDEGDLKIIICWREYRYFILKNFKLGCDGLIFMKTKTKGFTLEAENFNRPITMENIEKVEFVPPVKKFQTVLEH